MQKIKFIGLGGIGSYLINPVAQISKVLMKTCETSKVADGFEIHLIDGDEYEMKNTDRQYFLKYGAKTMVMMKQLTKMHDGLNVIPVPEYVTESNVSDLIQENDIVVVCVDNHKTRAIIEERALQMDKVCVISGGNDYYDGNVMCFGRLDGKTEGKTFSELHPEITKTHDKLPSEMTCQEKADEAPQIVNTNLMVASVMLNEISRILKAYPCHNEVFLDSNKNKVRPEADNKVVLEP